MLGYIMLQVATLTQRSQVIKSVVCLVVVYMGHCQYYFGEAVKFQAFGHVRMAITNTAMYHIPVRLRGVYYAAILLPPDYSTIMQAAPFTLITSTTETD